MSYSRCRTLMLNRTRKHSIIGAAGLLLMALLLDLYSPPTISAQSESTGPVLRREKIALMPFLKGKYGSDLAGVLQCPICDLYTDVDSIKPDCDQTLNTYVQDALELRHEEMAIPFQRVKEVYSEISMDEAKDTPLSMALKLGHKLSVDYVLVGAVWRYLDRKGSSLAVDRPSSVGFALYLIDLTTGKTVWSDMFSETQHSLSENILQAKGFLQMGGKWLTADELAQFGVKEIFKKFPF